ncbi:MAG: D-inositol-3-phosphate glycosyltransferase [Myxococcota bacterium]|nr:D-inositol-3-phosphate glycosyltransferase [Myxococcota bacterium]
MAMLRLCAALPPPRWKHVLACPPGGEMEKRARAQGVEVIPLEFDALPFRVNHLPWVSGKGVRRLHELIRETAPAIVHANAFYAMKYAAEATPPSTPLVWTLHNVFTRQNRVDRRLLNRASRVIACCQAARDAYRHVPGVPEKTVVVPYGVPEQPAPDSARKSIRATLGIPENAAVLLSAGKLIPAKGHDVLMRSFQLLHDRGLDPWLIIAGGSHDFAARSRELLKQPDPGARTRVRLTGWRDDIPALMRAADVFVFPSVSGEGLPISILEAMMAGLPVAASRIAGVPEAVTHERTGLLSRPGCAEELARHLERLIRDPALRETMGESARVIARERFSLQAMADGVERIWRDLAK